MGDSSSASSSESPQSAISMISSPHFAIDPQLVGTPSSSQALSDFDEADEDLGLDDEREEHPDAEEQESSSAFSPIKVGGRGRSRKGTITSGGVVKKSAGPGLTKDKENTGPRRNIISSVVATGPRNDDDDIPDDWRPTPEEYKKMSSKEKRQLRNKISARNFRVRRKGDYPNLRLLLHSCQS